MREKMINLLRARGIRSQEILDAFRSVPRELFLPPEQAGRAYDDCPMPIGFGQTISQPYIVALMLQELDVRKHHRVLDVGAGSGYQTAILARLVAKVCALERIEDLTERAMGVLAGLGIANVTICTADGSVGWPEEAPFDRIICGAAGPDIPQAWIDQLVDGGVIVAPVGGEGVQKLVRVEKKGNVVRRDQLADVRFVRLIGKAGFAE